VASNNLPEYEMHWYVLSLNPEPWRVGPISVGRKTQGNPYPVVGRDQQLYNYQLAVQEELKRQGAVMRSLKIGDEGYELVFFFHHVLESYQTATGRNSKDRPADLTNLAKATEDAIQGVLIDNDTFVVKQTNYISRSGHFGKPAGYPYIVIGVAPYLGHDPNELPSEVWEGVDAMLKFQKETQKEADQLPEQDVF
jgi:hypothetical protein